MRYLTTIGMLVTLILTMALWTGTCAAQQIPGGSYQQTCRDIGTRGSTLYATCEDGNGGRRSSELRDFERCSSEIQNIYGNLQCNMSGDGGRDGYQGGDNRGRDGDQGRDNLPRGSYIQTCQDVSINGDTLQARCQKGNGSWRQTSLRRYDQCRDIVNQNGRLKCAR
jgi:hypothetical protein